MKKTPILLLLFTACFCMLSYGQIKIIGYPKLNGAPLANTSIVIKDGNTILKTLNTNSKKDFSFMLDYGKVYHIYFQHAHSPVMYMEVVADNIPRDKYDYLMGYGLDVPFYNSADPDIDTTVFSKPFHRVIYNGKAKLIDDTTYNHRFERNILKKPDPPSSAIKYDIKPPAGTPEKEQPSIFAGSLFFNSDLKRPLVNRVVAFVDANGKVIKTTVTNRYGAFVFANILPSEVAKMTLDLKAEDGLDGTFSLRNAKGVTVATAKARAGGGGCDFNLSPADLSSMIDNGYTTNIGGKLVSSSPKVKKFFAGKTVYLSNKYNTVLKTTKTNLFGTFVFEDIKPDHEYFVGVDRSEIVAGEKIDLLTKDDKYVTSFDTLINDKTSMKVNPTATKIFNNLAVGDDDMKMDIRATIFGDNVNHPIGKLKIILLNDEYQVIDSVLTDNLGTFKFKYLPFLKRFYLSAENTDNVLDVFKNILIYSSDNNLIKIMTHQKGTKFSYKPVNAELSHMRDLEIDDPWLEYVSTDKKPAAGTGNRTLPPAPKSIVENILFDPGKYSITADSKEILDKIILVLNTNKALKIEIGAHTDTKGNEAANMALSQMRAKTVRDYITSAGIDARRIISKGYGETKPLNSCGDNCTEAEHAQNRRIEFKILGE